MKLEEARQEFSALLRLSVPVVLSQWGLIALGLVDTAIVGSTSKESFEAVALGRSIVFAMSSLGIGISMAIEPIASQAVAAGEVDTAWTALRRALYANLLLWLPLSLLCIGIVWSLPLLGICSRPIAHETLLNVIGQLPGLYGFVAFVATKSYLQVIGRTRALIAATIIANGLNWPICNLLVRGDVALVDWGISPLGFAGLGPLGAGLATSIANLLLFGLSFWAVRLALKPVQDVKHALEPSTAKLFRLGFPVGLSALAEIGVFSIASLLAAKFGSVHVDAYQIALMLASFTFMGALGISGATSVRVGTAIGEQRNARTAGLAGLVGGVGLMTCGAILFASCPHFLAQRFSHHQDVVVMAATLLRIAAVFQLFDGAQVIAAGALRGAGDVRFPFAANVVGHWCVGFPVAITLAFGFRMGAEGLWWGLTSGLITVSVILVARFVWITRNQIARV